MSKKSIIVTPSTRKILAQMGEQIRFARLRRGISCQLAADRAKISRQTLSKIENGSPSVSIGAYANVLHALNDMTADLLLVAKDDILQKKLQDIQSKIQQRSSKKTV